MDIAHLTALVHRVEQLAALGSALRASFLFVDEKDAVLANYRTIAGLCAQVIERLRPWEGQASSEMVEAVQVFLRIARLCTSEHDRIAQDDEARWERTRRWSEVHDEFEASQREGRPMRSDWSWERHARWEGGMA